MPYPITRIPTDDATMRHARSEELRAYIELRLTERYSEAHPDLVLDVVVARRSDYDEVKVFLSKSALIADAEAFLREMEQQLSDDGIAILTYVRAWTAPTKSRE
jgi:hypothetical protein